MLNNFLVSVLLAFYILASLIVFGIACVESFHSLKKSGVHSNLKIFLLSLPKALFAAVAWPFFILSLTSPF